MCMKMYDVHDNEVLILLIDIVLPKSPPHITKGETEVLSVGIISKELVLILQMGSIADV